MSTALILDDDVPSGKLTAIVLREAGWITSAAATSEMAVRILAAITVDVVIIGGTPPDKEVVVMEAHARRVPVVLVTDDGPPKNGYAAVVVRPIDISTFVTLVESAIGGTK